MATAKSEAPSKPHRPEGSVVGMLTADSLQTYCHSGRYHPEVDGLGHSVSVIALYVARKRYTTERATG